MIRFLDWLLSATLLVLCFPLFLLLSLSIIIDSRGPVLYRQKRVGRHGKEFSMWKFRTMHTGSNKGLQITIGAHDNRITRLGYYLRKFKLDELPQLVNVFFGEMSLVGPRPEVKKYVDLYTTEQREILDIRPGITDYASIAYTNESELLATQPDPEAYYIQHIMPEKIRLNKRFIEAPSVKNYFTILFLTVKKIVTDKKNSA